MKHQKTTDTLAQKFHINQSFKKKKQKLPDGAQLFDLLTNGNRFALAKAITKIENGHVESAAEVNQLMQMAWEADKKAIKIGITGAPGVGKSSLIEALVSHPLQANEKVAIITTDPSSHLSQGSILGDKTRMELGSNHPNCFIRSSPSKGYLGGLNQNCYKTTLLCEAAGYDYILVETVGVGQSEIELNQLVDFNILVLSPAAGDELQGIKRGIMETADMIVINKADGAMINAAKSSVNQYKNASQVLQPKYPELSRLVLAVSAIEGTGIETLWKNINTQIKKITKLGHLKTLRQSQQIYWAKEYLYQKTKRYFEQKIDNSKLSDDTTKSTISPIARADQWFDNFVRKINIE